MKYLVEQAYLFTYSTGETISWDIDKAWSIIKAKHKEPDSVVPINQLQYIKDVYELNPEKLKHADCSIPGLAAPIVDLSDPSKRTIYIIIDGIHRAVKALELGFEFWVFALTIEESKQCLMHYTPGTIPLSL